MPTSVKTDVVGPASGAIPRAVEQYIDDAAVLHSIRVGMTTKAGSTLEGLSRFDERIRAHLDGLVLAGEPGELLVDASLERLSVGSVFVAGVVALENRSIERLRHLYALAEADIAAEHGLLAAFAWVERPRLRGIVSELLASSNEFLRFLGLSVCAAQRADPGRAMHYLEQGMDIRLRARLLRVHGELGRLEGLRSCVAELSSEVMDCSFGAAFSAVLLGNRHAGLDALTRIAAEPTRLGTRAFRLALQAMDLAAAHAWLRTIATGGPDATRRLIQGSGLAGDPNYVPWLIGKMTDPGSSRVAGEAFSLICGADLAKIELETRPPDTFQFGPNDNPDDPNVDADEDDGLPWPDPHKVQAWWHASSHRFQPGMRYFMGQPLNRENCVRVLKEGFQRQRIAAALYLSLLNPGTPLFEWRAPAWRQQRLLAQMT